MALGADIWKGCFGADFDNNNVFIQDNGLMMNVDTLEDILVLKEG